MAAEVNPAMVLRRQYDVVLALPKDDIERANRLLDLGSQYRIDFQDRGTEESLDLALEVLSLGVESTPADHPKWPELCVVLAGAYRERHVLMGAMADLNKAMDLDQHNFDVLPPTHPSRGGACQGLGMDFWLRFRRTEKVEDIDKAITIHQDLFDNTSLDHPERGFRTGCLESDFGDRYAAFHQPNDLDKAIKFGEMTISLKQDQDDRATALMNIAHSHVLKYQNSEERCMEDFRKAAQYLQECIDITPLDNPRRAHRLWVLGELYAVSALDIFIKIMQIDDSIEDITGLVKEEVGLRVKAVRLLREALYMPSSPVVWRINSGGILYDMLGQLECWEDAFEVISEVFSLVPSLIPRCLALQDKQTLLGEMSWLPEDAATLALKIGKPPAVALEMLENTRGLIAGATYDICADVSVLESQHPELAQAYSRVCQQIRSSTLQGRRENDSAYRAQRQFDEVLAKIQSLPGFNYFPLSSFKSDLSVVAGNKAIVIVNVSQYLCVAFIVYEGEVLQIDLPLLRLNEIEKKSWNPTPTTELLAWLWDCIAEPILDKLGFTEYPGDGRWPRVCWILTGSLARFPIHAAASSQWTSSNGSSNSVMDRVISSYSPSIRALSHCEQPPRRNQSTSPHQRNMIVVGMDKTPGHGSLPFVQEEVRQLGSLAGKMNLELHELSKKTELLALLPNCEIFHFAGHGLSNSRDPSQSCLLLQDWEQDPLTVANLFEVDIEGKRPFLAYLSACGSGRVKRDKRYDSIDQSIHMIGGFLLAGFRHVVGTLAEVRDETCVEIAALTYAWIKDHGMSDESVSEGLHHACRALREREMAGGGYADTADRRDGRDILFLNEVFASYSWVPFMHFGL